jgi:LPXTG-motif cell wall-anchored protein
MKRLKFVAIMCCFVFVALAITPQVKADEYNKKTTMTFSEPFEVPGVGAQVLPAGTYVFKLVDSLVDRDIVQVTSTDEKHVYTTILAIPNYRLKATDKTVLTFGERGAGQPEAIKAWFYPGETWGQQFVYPKSRAIETTEAVPVETLRTVQVAAIQPTGEEIPAATLVEAPPAAAAVVAQTLPQTASSLPLFALIGLLSLCAGFTLLIITKRSA